MNASIITRQGITNQLNKIIAGWLNSDIWVHLFGPVGPSLSETTTLADCLALEATFAGYTFLKLGPWLAPTLQFGSGGLSEYGQTTANASWFISAVGGTGNMWGFFLTDALNSVLFGAAIFPFVAPIAIPQGEFFDVTVEYLFFSYFPYPPVPLP